MLVLIKHGVQAVRASEIPTASRLQQMGRKGKPATVMVRREV
jgi:hypothetical protein